MIGDAYKGVIGEVLILHGHAAWGKQEAAAWEWFWGRLENALSRTMDAHECNFADLVSSSWAEMQASHSSEVFGNEFYAEMQRTAPELVALFVRPKTLQHSTFIRLMETLVEFVQDPETFYHQASDFAHNLVSCSFQSVNNTLQVI